MQSFVVAFKIVIPDESSLRDSEGSNFVSRPLVLLAPGNQVSNAAPSLKTRSSTW
jgi:hypothetical protein